MSDDRAHVSAHDSAVLNRIFNPNLPYGDVVDEEEVEKEIGNTLCIADTLFCWRVLNCYFSLNNIVKLLIRDVYFENLHCHYHLKCVLNVQD